MSDTKILSGRFTTEDFNHFRVGSVLRVSRFTVVPVSDDKFDVTAEVAEFARDRINVGRLADAMYLAHSRGLIYGGITNRDEAEVYASLYNATRGDPDAHRC